MELVLPKGSHLRDGPNSESVRHTLEGERFVVLSQPNQTALQGDYLKVRPAGSTEPGDELYLAMPPFIESHTAVEIKLSNLGKFGSVTEKLEAAGEIETLAFLMRLRAKTPWEIETAEQISQRIADFEFYGHN